jgi:hypothetical protein
MSFLSREVRPLRVVTPLVGVLAVTVAGAYVFQLWMAPTWSKLRPDMTIAQTIQIMGSPTDEVVDEDRSRVELWYSADATPCKVIFVQERLTSLSLNGVGKGGNPLGTFRK